MFVIEIPRKLLECLHPKVCCIAYNLSFMICKIFENATVIMSIKFDISPLFKDGSALMYNLKHV